MRLPTDPELRQATKDSSSGLLRDHVLLDPAYTATNGSTVVSDYPVTTALATQVYFFSNKV
jgi:hypothetical protein